MNGVAELFFQAAAMNPSKEAIWCDGARMRYDELSDFVCRYANFLKERGVRRGEIIGVPMTNSIESVALIFAASCIGAGLAPINPTLPLPAIDAAFQSGGVRHVIARRAFLSQAAKAGLTLPGGLILCLDGEAEGALPLSLIREASSERPDLGGITGHETLILTMTSGSTGAPKPIELTQQNKLDRSLAHARLYGITAEDRVLAATPLYHSLAERLVILPLILGATAILMPRFTPTLWLNCVRDQKVTFTIAVSAQLGQIVQLLSSPFMPDMKNLRAVVSSSALLEPHVRTELIEKLHCDFYEMYGTSETSTVTSINFREARDKQRSVGRPIPGASVRVLRDGGGIAGTGETGEITCRTELLFNGYYRMPEMTAAALQDGYFRTGDLGRLDGDGYLYFCGRKKELIITGGINVYPQDIEKCVMELPGVTECAAFSYPDERLGEVVALAVVAEMDASVAKRAVQTHCAKNLADFQQPHHILLMDALPKNEMGKIQKSRILEAARRSAAV
jgi:acyl-CoA synthetase (AMP-forming)/AMP-acid ligase II